MFSCISLYKYCIYCITNSPIRSPIKSHTPLCLLFAVVDYIGVSSAVTPVGYIDILFSYPVIIKYIMPNG